MQTELEALRQRLLRSLRKQGFKVKGERLSVDGPDEKDTLRSLHRLAVDEKRRKAQRRLQRKEEELLQCLINGADLDIDRIDPVLEPVERGTFDELLFRYACLHWSVPVSSGYGRRLRYLIRDRGNGNALIGLIGLHDPVIALKARDRWIKWDAKQRVRALHNVLDAYVLGAVPPYSALLGGKLVAMLAATDTIRRDFRAKYGRRRARISNRILNSRLAMITTASALGRSSVYNRISVGDRKLFNSVGFTEGSGEFHFANGLYEQLASAVKASAACPPKLRHKRWGKGFRNRREVIILGLKLLGLSPELRWHTVEREVFVVPLARNTESFLRGESKELRCFRFTTAQAMEHYRERWLRRRAITNMDWRRFDRETWRLWPRLETKSVR